ncbi:MAG: hypothetical protein AAGC92_16810 [Pseudomonadota bacterium]
MTLITRRRPRIRGRSLVGLLAIFLAFATIEVEAASLVLNPVDRGWYGRVTGQEPSNRNFLVGKCCRQVHRNFFAFDLSGVSGPVTRAFFKIDAGIGAFQNTAATTAFRLRKFAGNQTELLEDRAGFDGYKGLRDRSAPFYGAKNVETPGVNGTMPLVRVSLNRGLADLNTSLGSMLILGGHTRGPGSLWAFSGSVPMRSIKLVLETGPPPAGVAMVATPLPPSLSLLLGGLAGLAGLALWHRRKAAAAS